MGFIYSQLIETRKLPYPSTSYSGKTIIITGSNTGLGKEAARHYARLGAKRLILAVRNLGKGEAAKKDIATTAAAGVDIQVWEIDMAQPSSIRAFAARLERDLDRVDIFHANAGLVSAHYREVPGFGAEGLEMNLAVNYVATYLLVARVLPKLKSTAADFSIRPVLVITSSGAHRHTQFPQKSEPNLLEAINHNREDDPARWKEQYPLSKLLGAFAVRSIADEQHPAASSDSYPVVTVNAVSPGLCRSDLAREATGVERLAFGLMQALLARTAEQGSRTLVAAGVAGPESHGRYLEDCRVGEFSEVVTQNPDVGRRLWVELKAKLEEIEPGVTSNFG
ncbi:NAD(P)-binding protein [Xylariaceae sp. FL0804]|nr:NAD(P)-binding protein [Xylariaceae sp. FL0804]